MDGSNSGMTLEENTWSTLKSSRLVRYLATLLPLRINNEDTESDTKPFSYAEEPPECREFPLPHHLQPAEAIVIVEETVCRICHESDNGRGRNRLVAPCKCKGSAEYVHKKCLHKWCETKKTTDCEICHSPYQPIYLKAPPLSTSDENSLVASSMVLALLFGVFLISVYFFVSHLAAVEFVFRGDSWLLLSLAVAAFVGFSAFLIWFIKNLRRIILTRRAQLMKHRRGSEPVTLSVIATNT